MLFTTAKAGGITGCPYFIYSMEFKDFYAQKFDFVYKIAFAYLFDKNMVEDIVQDTFLIAHETYAKLMKHENVDGWLVVTVKHLSNDAAKRKIRYVSSPAVYEDDRGLLELLPFDFPEQDTSILTDFYEKGYSIPYIALRRGISVGAVRIRLCRARAKLKNRLKQNDTLNPYQDVGGVTDG